MTLRLAHQRSYRMGDTNISKEIKKSDSEWRELLGKQRYHVLREKGTERAFTGDYTNLKDEGTYHCGACGQVLFSSSAKYDSGSGWPSFYEPIDGRKITEMADNSYGMVRTEVVCSACKSHLGHVFNDGPVTTTGLRYCINSLSLDFNKS